MIDNVCNSELCKIIDHPSEDWIKKSDPAFGKPTSQAFAAMETVELYKWWKEVRPKRLDPMDASGLSDYYQADGEHPPQD